MISGFELRNNFNLTLRGLYSVKDSSMSSVSGRSYTSNFSSKSSIDIYLSMCYDEIDKYTIDNISEKNLLDFIQDIEKITLHFFENDIKENTRNETLKFLKTFLNQTIENYDSINLKQQSKKTINTLNSFKKKNLFEKISKKENISTLNIDKKDEILQDEEEYNIINLKKNDINNKNIKKKHKFPKKNKKINNNDIQRKYDKNTSYHKNNFKDSKIIHNNEKNKEKFFSFKKILFFIILILILGGIVYYIKFIENQEISTFENISEDEIELVLEKPPEPILEEFSLNNLEENLFKKINERRVQYQKSKYEINLKLSELNNDYLYIFLTEGKDKAEFEVGSSVERGELSDGGSGMIESRYTFDQEVNVETMLESIRLSNLYLEEYNGMGLAIIQYNNKTNVLISIYKND